MDGQVGGWPVEWDRRKIVPTLDQPTGFSHRSEYGKKDLVKKVWSENVRTEKCVRKKNNFGGQKFIFSQKFILGRKTFLSLNFLGGRVNNFLGRIIWLG